MAGDGATLHFGSWNSRDFTVQYVRRGMDVGVARYLGSVPFALPLSPTGDVVEIALEDCREVPYSQLPVVFVVDDDIDLCRTVQRLLVAAGYEVCIYHSADEFLAAGERHRSGCVVLDIRMPGISGPELHRQLVAGGSEMAVVIASGHADVSTSVQAMKLGAVDVLEKPFSRDELLGAINNAVSKLHAMQRQREEREALEYLHDTLSSREKEVFAFIVNGHTSRQVGGELGASEKTIKLHRRRIMTKMGVGTLTDLVRVAERLGL